MPAFAVRSVVLVSKLFRRAGGCLGDIPPPIVERSIVMSVSVCLSVYMSVHDHIFVTTVQFSPIFLHMLPVAVARSSSGGVVIRYVLPVLWMMPYFL